AGDSISIPFSAIDTNLSPCSPNLFTLLSLEPTGYQFDTSFNDPQGNCPIKPCATLNPAPAGGVVKKLTGYQQVSTVFSWQTTCDHLVSAGGGVPVKEARFNFVMKVYDDFC